NSKLSARSPSITRTRNSTRRTPLTNKRKRSEGREGEIFPSADPLSGPSPLPSANRRRASGPDVRLNVRLYTLFPSRRRRGFGLSPLQRSLGRIPRLRAVRRRRRRDQKE